jgi:hypothetical protein
LARAPGKVAIYGWHRTNGAAIQPLYLGHTNTWVDYSQCVRLVEQKMIVNGTTTTVARVLADPILCGLLSDEGVIAQPRYATGGVQFVPGGNSGEQVAIFVQDPEVKIHVNAPAATEFAPGKPVRLVFYALPNGNSIAQTLGHTIGPGEDWHFDIQHLAAQLRFLRHVLTNETVVLACLEAGGLSWPAWRKAHGDAPIPGILGAVKNLFPTNRLKIVLSGHSGGGGLIFGYLNTVEAIPDEIERIAFLDSNYAYDPARGHGEKLAAWLAASEEHWLTVLAYDDASALLDGKPFVTPAGGTWGRSHAMLKDLESLRPAGKTAGVQFLGSTNREGVEIYRALHGRVEFLLKENPRHEILHTVQVERNGFIHAMLAGTEAEGRGYEYFGPRAYTQWITAP